MSKPNGMRKSSLLKKLARLMAARRPLTAGCMTAVLLVGVASGCSRKEDPNAAARAKAQQEAMTLRQDSRKLELKAETIDVQADQLRLVAKALMADGKTNVLAGRARQEAGDLEDGRALEDHGHDRIASAERKLEEADTMEAHADNLRGEAARLDKKAETVIASVPLN